MARATLPLGLLALLLALTSGCRRREPERAAGPGGAARPSFLLVTLDTTRADAVGPEAPGTTPSFDALAARGLRFRHAYATAPETLPAHASIMTGLLPPAHGVHQNARALAGTHAVLAERLRQAGYTTAAFVSSFVLARRFGLARGFETYDDALPPGPAERTAAETTERALAHLRAPRAGPLFLWVHYFDPHAPYTPPEPFRSRYAARPYLGEVAFMDAQLGRLVQAFEQAAGGKGLIVVVGDHGEGLGDHGEAQHGNLLYQATMRVPLVLAGPGVAHGVRDEPVSARRLFSTLLERAGLGGEGSLLRPAGEEVVLGEAMKPFLAYGWQPQVMALAGRYKAILAGRRLEAYDLVADPGETRDLGESAPLPRALRSALREYPHPALGEAAAPAALTEEDRRRLAALGYVASAAAPLLRPDAPRPADMTALFELLDRASFLFVSEEYRRAIPLLRRILERDPGNLDALLRLATAHSRLGQEGPAEAAFRRARALAPWSEDVPVYLALHQARGRQWPSAVPVLEEAAARAPDRLPVLEALAAVRERQGRLSDAVELHRRIHLLREPEAPELLRLGGLAMAAGQTAAALEAFEDARRIQGAAFRHELELGVLYLDARRLEEARDALDRVRPTHPEYALALFKRAQVSVLLNEPDRAARVERALRHADATTRGLIARERLFQGLRGP